MKPSQKLRLEAAHLALGSYQNSDPSAAQLFAMAIMWENYLILGADKTQERMKILPTDTAEIVKLVPKKGAD